MKVYILKPTIIGGIDYQPTQYAQNVPEHIGIHLIEIGNAKQLETKVVEVTEKKISSSSQVAPVSRKRTATRRKARKPKR